MNGEYDIREEADLSKVVAYLNEQRGAARVAASELLLIRLAEEVIALKAGKRATLSLAK